MTPKPTSSSPGPPGSGTDPVGLSVVVPTRDRTTRLLLTLTALGRQTLPPERYEVVLVNDAADAAGSDLAQVLAAVPAHLPLRTAATGGRGPARARNEGAALARGDVLLFLDDDTVATPGLLEAHLRAHDFGGALVVHGAVTDLSAFALTPDPAVLRPALVGARGRSIDAAALVDLAEHARLFGPRRSFIERTARAVLDAPGHEPLHWLACIGTNTSVRRTVFDRAGGFDEHYGERWGGEDLELGLRLKATGAAFALLDATAYHLPGPRRDAADLLATFWRLVAERHGDPRLAEVGAFLAGRLPLARLADLLAPAAASAAVPGRAGP
ncbi:glycosyltransferase family 2 protein [Streptomyces sp. NPDC003860]